MDRSRSSQCLGLCEHRTDAYFPAGQNSVDKSYPFGLAVHSGFASPGAAGPAACVAFQHHISPDLVLLLLPEQSHGHPSRSSVHSGQQPFTKHSAAECAPIHLQANTVLRPLGFGERGRGARASRRPACSAQPQTFLAGRKAEGKHRKLHPQN